MARIKRGLACGDFTAGPPVAQSPPDEVATAIRQCRRSSKQASGTFHHAFKLFPTQHRDTMHVLYEFCRRVDDAVDDADAQTSGEQRLQDLERNFSASQPNNDLWVALDWVQQRYHIPSYLFLDLIRGARTDLGDVAKETLQELYRYCYHVAGTVGLMTLRVMGNDRDLSPQYSLSMARAFQLTNILRDVSEDRDLDRCYIPTQWLREAGALDDWKQRRMSPALRRVLKRVGRLAVAHYRRCVELIPRISKPFRWSLAMMVSAYSDYLRQIHDQDWNAWSMDVSIGALDLPRLLWTSRRAVHGRPEQCLML